MTIGTTAAIILAIVVALFGFGVIVDAMTKSEDDQTHERDENLGRRDREAP